MSDGLAFATVVLLVVLIVVVQGGVRRILKAIQQVLMAMSDANTSLAALLDVEAKKQSFRIGAGRELLRERLRQKVAEAEGKPA